MAEQLIDILREESESEHVAFTEFALLYKKDEDILYCFFEGNECKKYYALRIKYITEKLFYDFSCGGKESVLKAYNLITAKKEYEINRILFFIDRDFDQTHISKDIYMTPYYSIENFYTSVEALIEILKNEFNLKEENPDFMTAIDLYKKLQSEFHKRTLIINSWLASQHDIRKDKGIKTHLNIDQYLEKYFKRIVNEDLNSLSDFSDLNDVDFIENNIFINSPKVAKQSLNRKIGIFKKSVTQKAFRGKFELRFLVSFLNRLKDEICKKKPNLFTKKYKCNLRFEYINALSVLTQYAETTTCLTKYLKGFKTNTKKHNQTLLADS